MSEWNWNLVAVPSHGLGGERGLSGELAWRIAGGLERMFALGALAALSPVLLAAGVTIRCLSGEAPLVAHLRVGRKGRPLWMLKFRTMWGDRRRRNATRPRLVERISDEAGPSLKSFSDPRVRSRFARFCRRFSIDELPQLLHVARGEMSLVGPRPLTAGELEEHYDGCADEVLEVKPGLSGLWQVMGRNRLSYEQRRAYDLLYVRNRSLRLYLTILARTPVEVFSGRNSC